MELEQFKLLHDRFSKGGFQYGAEDATEFEEYMEALHSNKECSEWHMISILKERKFDYSKHCCLQMSFQISQPKTLPEDEDDPDIIMLYNEIFDEYGIPIYDGGTSVISIDFCPWCGNKLPSSKRDDWFHELGDLAYGDDLSKIPEEYKSDQWWRNSGKP